MTATCEHCGQPYASRGRHMRFCSAPCREEWVRRSRLKARHYRRCLQCRRRFLARRSSHVYCSALCNERHWLAKRREQDTTDDRHDLAVGQAALKLIPEVRMAAYLGCLDHLDETVPDAARRLVAEGRL